jgi:hypothetical protein
LQVPVTGSTSRASLVVERCRLQDRLQLCLYVLYNFSPGAPFRIVEGGGARYLGWVVLDISHCYLAR